MVTHRITAVIVNFNGMRTVLETIRSILSMPGVAWEIIVVDDGSTDGSPEAIQREFSCVRVVREPHNTGEVNRLRSKGLALAGTRYVLLTDNDITFDPECGRSLLAAMLADAAVGACIPRLMYAGHAGRVCYGGGLTHYVAATIAPGRNSEGYAGPREPMLAVGGGMALLDMHKLGRVGTFDEGYAMAWGDDGELHQRLLLAGYKTLMVPAAVGYHEYKPFGRDRHYRARGQIRNRWRFLGTHYSLRTLVLIAPALALYEGLQAGFYLLRRVPHLYVLGMLDALRALPATLRRRRKIQALRAVPDKDILFAGPIYVRADHKVSGPVLRLVLDGTSRFFTAYWRAIRPLLSDRHAGARGSGT
jgi:GT2 family glycosyltransferase